MYIIEITFVEVTFKKPVPTITTPEISANSQGKSNVKSQAYKRTSALKFLKQFSKSSKIVFFLNQNEQLLLKVKYYDRCEEKNSGKNMPRILNYLKVFFYKENLKPKKYFSLINYNTKVTKINQQVFSIQKYKRIFKIKKN